VPAFSIRGMADMTVPDSLADLQRSFDAARKAVREHHRATGPVLEWTDEQRAEGDRQQAAWVQVATELRAAVADFGLEAEHGAYKLGRALRKAAYGDDYAGE
jgi:hypothetical protein